MVLGQHDTSRLLYIHVTTLLNESAYEANIQLNITAIISFFRTCTTHTTDNIVELQLWIQNKKDVVSVNLIWKTVQADTLEHRMRYVHTQMFSLDADNVITFDLWRNVCNSLSHIARLARLLICSPIQIHSC